MGDVPNTLLTDDSMACNYVSWGSSAGKSPMNGIPVQDKWYLAIDEGVKFTMAARSF
jgi:hypothetical protein